MRLSDDLGFGLKDLPANTVGFALSQLSPPPATGASSEWQSYVTNGRTTPPDVQASTEAATAGTYTDHQDGTYTYVFAQDLASYPAAPVHDATKTHRLGVEIRTNRVLPYNIPANNAPYDFVPAGGSPAFTRLIVNDAACNACHDNLEIHGEARFDVNYCMTCHNPYSIDPDTAAEEWGGTVDMTEMIHKIHNGTHLTFGYAIVGYGPRLHDYSDFEFSQDIRNCTTCHQDSDPTVPQASNWEEVQNRVSCGSCHDWIDWDGSSGDPDRLHWGSMTFLNDQLCVDCHGKGTDVLDGEYQVAVAHEIPEQVAAEAFEYEVVSVTDSAPGERPTVQIRVLDPTDPAYAGDPASTAYDINDPNGPFQQPGASIRVNVAWNTDELGNLDPDDELDRDPVAGSPFQPLRIDFKTGAANVGGNVFEKTSDVGDIIPLTATGSGVAYLEGRPVVDIEGDPTSIGVPSDGLTFAIDDAPDPVDRRPVVNIDKCNDCHKELSLHGDNRVGNTELCATCHNANVTDIDKRAGSCATDLGTEDATVDLKVMVHAIHAFDYTEQAYSACGYGNRPHTWDFTYPGKLNNCEGCHLEGTFYPVDPAAVLATTIDAAPEVAPGVPGDRSTLTDDVAISPNTAVCSSCHVTDLARNHMIQNGGDFSAGKDDTGALISAGNETCQLCHGPGASADTGVMHGVGGFQFN